MKAKQCRPTKQEREWIRAFHCLQSGMIPKYVADDGETMHAEMTAEFCLSSASVLVAFMLLNLKAEAGVCVTREIAVNKTTPVAVVNELLDAVSDFTVNGVVIMGRLPKVRGN